jgi:hypothetical protein
VQYATKVRKGCVLEENLSYCEMLQMKHSNTDYHVIMGECPLWKIFGPQI